MVYASVDADIAYTNFMTIFNALYNKFFPLMTKKIKTKHLNKPFINDNIKNLISQKNALQRKYMKRPITYESSYKNLRNKITNEIRKSKIRYYNEKFAANSGNIKNSWKVINTILKRNNKKEYKNAFEVDGVTVTEDEGIAECFNDFFVNIGSNLANNLPPSQDNFNDFLNEPCLFEFNFLRVKELCVENAISSLNNSSSGMDDISINVVKQSVCQLSNVFSSIVNKSLETSIVPNKLKIARVTPIFKC